MTTSKFLYLVIICVSTIGFLSCTSKKPCSSDTDAIVPETMPRLLTGFDTIYPPLARQAGIEGIIGVKSSINDKGRVLDSKTTRNSGSTAGFEETTIESGKKNLWIPAYSLRGPIPYRSYYEVIFISHFIMLGKSPRNSNDENRLSVNLESSSDSAVEIHPVYDIPPTIEKTATVHYTGEESLDNMVGSIWLQVTVNDSGRVKNVLISHSSIYDLKLEDDLISAFYNYIYKPAMYQGKPVAVQIECEIVYAQQEIWVEWE